MEERIIRLPELMMFHQITEVWNESIACFSMDSSMKNISKVPPVLADMFSFILVEEGTARYVLNYKGVYCAGRRFITVFSQYAGFPCKQQRRF